jgi:hypothetical protein
MGIEIYLGIGKYGGEFFNAIGGTAACKIMGKVFSMIVS